MKIISIEERNTETSFDMDFQSLTEINNFQGSIAVERVILKGSTYYEPHFHKKSDAFLYFLKGSGTVIDKEGNEYPFNEGSTVYFPAMMKHGFSTNEEVVFLTVQSPPILSYTTGEEDIFFNENTKA